MNIIEYLEDKIKPQYVGWQDQYRAVLYVLGVPHDTPAEEVLEALSLVERPIHNQDMESVPSELYVRFIELFRENLQSQRYGQAIMNAFGDVYGGIDIVDPPHNDIWEETVHTASCEIWFDRALELSDERASHEVTS